MPAGTISCKATSSRRVSIRQERHADGSIVLSNEMSLGVYPATIDECLRHWRTVHAQHVFIAERIDGHWLKLTYEQVADDVETLAARLLTLELTAERPLAIVSANSILHAEITFAAMRIGVPVAPISPNYALRHSNSKRLQILLALLTPGAIYLDQPSLYRDSLADIAVPLLSGSNDSVLPVRGLQEIPPAPRASVEQAAARINPDTIAKFLFTSGSTGGPKCVINTQRMLCSTQKALAQTWSFLSDRPPVLVDWMPWSHMFGGNCCFNLVLFHGGTLYIDGGKPLPGLIERTVDNLRSVAPTMYFNVPAGYQALLPYLESDPKFAAGFFKDLDCLFSGGAALPTHIRQRLFAVCTAATGRAPFFATSLGATETGPVTVVYFATDDALNVGVPMPGTSLKLVPRDGKMELAVRSPSLMPGYWRQPEASDAAFDEEGFYLLGDAGQLIDPDNPARGIAFHGRITENFKLTSGTWINAGAIRLAVINAGEPVIADAVVTGHDRDQVGVLLFVNWKACREMLGEQGATLTESQLVDHPAIVRHVLAGLLAHNASHPASSTRVARFAFLIDAPSIEAGEITEKNSLNQRAILERRRTAVDDLYAKGHVVAE